jgi:hypothetical protein
MSTSELWKAEGDYFESCNCDSTCPCIFLADPDEGDCKLTIAWHIDKGRYDSIKLDGLNVAGAFYAPGNMATGPKWEAALYLDERANQEQADALLKIFSGQAGGVPGKIAEFIGQVKGVRSVPIQFVVKGKRRQLLIPDVVELEIEGVNGADPNRESLITNPALYGAAGFDPALARSIRHSFHDHGMEWNNSGKNGFYSRFSYTP